jgi:hypothetical protein
MTRRKLAGFRSEWTIFSSWIPRTAFEVQKGEWMGHLSVLNSFIGWEVTP